MEDYYKTRKARMWNKYRNDLDLLSTGCALIPILGFFAFLLSPFNREDISILVILIWLPLAEITLAGLAYMLYIFLRSKISRDFAEDLVHVQRMENLRKKHADQKRKENKKVEEILDSIDLQYVDLNW